MKKNLILVALAIVTSLACKAQVKFGIQTGLNIASLKWEDQEIDPIARLYVEGSAKVSLNNSLSLESGLSLQGRGAKNTTSGNKYRYRTIELPVQLFFDLPIGNATLGLGGGIFGGLNVSGKINYADRSSEDLDFGPILETSADEWKRLDYGALLSSKYTLSSGWLAKVGYSFGLANIAQANSPKISSRGFSIGVGYEF